MPAARLVNPVDTIAAIATPPGEGGLAVIRISGPEALAVADRCFRAGRGGARLASVPSHTVHHGWVVGEAGPVDEVLVTVLRAPRSYTREDTVEIGCHGGVMVSRQVLDAVLAAGARLAAPGEFTRRAFVNGRLDLAQAEAVADLIHARSELAARAAVAQLQGHLSARIQRLRDGLMHVLAHVEAQLDFPDEDIDPETGRALLARMESVRREIGEVLATADEGRILRHGLRVAIVGLPNAGKSSLLNRLLGEDRAIVTPVAGTTRDTLEESASIRGWPVVLVDTAGLRDGADEVEAEGIRRARLAAESAELLLHVVDASRGWSPEDEALRSAVAGRRALVVWNKSDLGTCAGPDGLPVSCRTGAGLEGLRDRIATEAGGAGETSAAARVAIGARHRDALARSAMALDRALVAMGRGDPLDLLALDLRVAVNAVGEVVGKTATDDLLDLIFGTFCLGK